MSSTRNMDTGDGLYDAHCHPTDIMSAVDRISVMSARALTIMATRAQDQKLVYDTAEKYRITAKTDLETSKDARYIVPAFGWHPWFAHQLYDDRGGKNVVAREHYRRVLTPTPSDDDNEFLDSLPAPRPLSEYIAQTEEYLKSFPLALVGEIGLDRSFRVPYSAFRCPDDPEQPVLQDVNMKTGGEEEGEYTPGSREGRPFTPYRVSMEHQKLILKAQLELAARCGRAVSVHSVATHGVAFDVFQSLWKGHEKLSKSQLKKQKNDVVNAMDRDECFKQDQAKTLPYPTRICMHSYSGPRDALKQFLGPRVPADIYFSFSELVNFGSHNSNKAAEVIKAIPDDKILIESDLHCAGPTMDRLLKDIFARVCEIKGWDHDHGRRQLKLNWEKFIFGDEG